MDSSIKLPVCNEKIHRSIGIAPFDFVLKVRAGIVNIFNLSKKNKKKHDTKSTVENGAKQKKGFLKNLKDLISLVLCFPDFARPWLFPAIIQGIKIIRKHKIDVIFSTGMPWTSLIIGYFLKTFTGKKLVIDFRDPWVDNPFIKKGKLEKFLDRKWESLVVKKADLIIANTNALKQEMENRYRRFKEKITIVPNGYDIIDFQNIPKTKLPEDKFFICHAGFLYLKRDPISVLKALEILKRDHPDIASIVRFLQIGKIYPNPFL